MPRLWSQSTEERMYEAVYLTVGSSEWYMVTIHAADGTQIMEVPVLMKAAVAALMKEFGEEGVTLKVSRKIETLEPI